MNMENNNEKTIEEIELECLKKIEEVLKHYNCKISVDFIKGETFGITALQYKPVIVFQK